MADTVRGALARGLSLFHLETLFPLVFHVFYIELFEAYIDKLISNHRKESVQRPVCTHCIPVDT